MKGRARLKWRRLDGETREMAQGHLWCKSEFGNFGNMYDWISITSKTLGGEWKGYWGRVLGTCVEMWFHGSFIYSYHSSYFSSYILNLHVCISSTFVASLTIRYKDESSGMRNFHWISNIIPGMFLKRIPNHSPRRYLHIINRKEERKGGNIKEGLKGKERRAEKGKARGKGREG